MEKAYLEIEGKNKIYVQFNPSEYNLSRSVSYSEKKIAGLDGPIVQFMSGESQNLDLNLTFDSYKPPSLEDVMKDQAKEGGEDVSKTVRMLDSLLIIDGTLHRPPKVTFCWGSLRFSGIVTKIDSNYTMFLSNGMPVRAKVKMSLQSLYDVEKGKLASPFESPDRTKVKVVKEKEQLWNYAWEEYGDVEKWREIARENGMKNPLLLTPGQKIKIPAL